MQFFPAKYTSSSSESSSTELPSYRSREDSPASNVESDQTKSYSIGPYVKYAAIWLSSVTAVAFILFAWAVYVPGYLYPWDSTQLADRVPNLLILSKIVTVLSLILLPLVIGILFVVFDRCQLDNRRPPVSCLDFMASLGTALLIMVTIGLLITGIIVRSLKPTEFALSDPYAVSQSGVITSKKHESDLGTFTRTNDTTICSYYHSTASPFKQINYKIEDDAISFDMTCWGSSKNCGHGVITYSDREVWMDVFSYLSVSHSISSVKPEFHATPGPWRNHTSLYSSDYKLFMISRDKQIKVYGKTPLWRAFGSCWSAITLTI